MVAVRKRTGMAAVSKRMIFAMLTGLHTLLVIQASDGKPVAIRLLNSTEYDVDVENFESFYKCLVQNCSQLCHFNCNRHSTCNVTEKLQTDRRDQDEIVYQCSLCNVTESIGVTCFRNDSLSATSDNVQHFRMINSSSPCVSLSWESGMDSIIANGFQLFNSCDIKVSASKTLPVSDYSGTVIFVVVKFVIFVSVCVIAGLMGRKYAKDKSSVRGLTLNLWTSKEQSSESGSLSHANAYRPRQALIPLNHSQPGQAVNGTAGSSLGHAVMTNGAHSDAAASSSAGQDERASVSSQITYLHSPVSPNVPDTSVSRDRGNSDTGGWVGGSNNVLVQPPFPTVGQSTAGYINITDVDATRESVTDQDYSSPRLPPQINSAVSNARLCMHACPDSPDTQQNYANVNVITTVDEPQKEGYVDLLDDVSNATYEVSALGQSQSQRTAGTEAYMNVEGSDSPTSEVDDEYSSVRELNTVVGINFTFSTHL